MFATALIVFRETLEAALFVGIIAAATRGLTGRGRWLGAGIGSGVLGALLLALLADRIAGLADGLGQDLVNVAILTLALGMLGWHAVFGQQHGREAARAGKRLGIAVQGGKRAPAVLAVAVALAVLREGAETVLFVAGLSGGESAASARHLIMLGVPVGLAAGAAVGVLIYFGLSRVPAHRMFAVTNALIVVLAASIASQLARALAQAGLVDRWTAPLWDSSSWLAPESALGTMLHALVGYDARPSGLQLLFYGATVALIVAASRLARPQAAPATPAPLRTV
jgi:high-affinity iron transporter